MKIGYIYHLLFDLYNILLFINLYLHFYYVLYQYTNIRSRVQKINPEGECFTVSTLSLLYDLS